MLALLGVVFSTVCTFAGPVGTVVNYTSSTAFIGVVKINQYDASFPVTVVEGDYIGAYAGDECRMMAEVFSYDGELYVSSVIQGGDITDMTGSTMSEPEEVEFRVWSSATETFVNATVQGTLFTESTGEIFDYEIGKPNTGNTLESLTVASYTLSPAFSEETDEYTISVPFGTELPSATDYVAVAADSRAIVDVTEATEYDAEGKATSTITVTAENGDTKDYTVTFVQAACPTVAPVLSEFEGLKQCQGSVDVIIAAFGGKSETAVWYDGETSKTPLASTNEFKHGKTDVGTYTYYVAKNDGVCESTERLPVTLTINEKPAPTIENLDETYCVNSAAITLTASISGGTFTVNGEAATSFDPATANIGSNVVEYVVTDDNTCVGSTEATVEVIELPEVTLSVNNTMCSSDDPQVLSATPATGTWEGEGVSLSGGSYVFTPQKTSSLTYTYESGVCKVVKTATITVSDSPTPVISGLETSYCSNAAVVSLSAEPAGGTFLLNDVEVTSFDPSKAVAGENTISYTVIVKGCEGTAEKTVTVLAAPTIDLSGISADACANQEVALRPTDGTWKGTGVSGTTFVSASKGDFTLTYTETSDGCTASESVVISVNEATAPVVTSATVELNGDVPALKAAGNGTIQWYETEDGAVVSTDASFIPAVSTSSETTYTYYVSNTENGCESEKVPVTLTITSCSTEAPVIADVEPVCDGDAFPTLKATGTNITWYSSITGGDALASGDTYTPTAAGTYYASQNPGCEGSRASVKVTVKEKPSAPTAVGASSCMGADLVAMTSSEAVNWYADKNSDALATDAKSYTPADVTETTTFYVNRVENGCASDFAEVVYTVKPRPAAPNGDIRYACFGNDYDYYVRVTVSSGATLQWYDENNMPKGTETIQEVQVPSVVTKQTIIAYTVSQTIDQCTSEFATSFLYVNPLPTPKIMIESSYCSDSNETIEVTSDLDGGDFSIDGKTTSTFVPSKMSVGAHDVSYIYEDANGCYGEEEVQFSIVDCSDPDVTSITLSSTSLSLVKGDTYSDLSVTILPADAPQTVTWSSSDETVAKVSTNGSITAVGPGDAIVTATSSYTTTQKAQCMVKVIAPAESVSFTNTEDIVVEEGGFVDLSKYLKINPDNASIKKISWSLTSSDATLSAEGVFTAGIVSSDVTVPVTVTITSEDGSTVSATVPVTIEKSCSLSAPVVANASQSICVGDEAVTFEASGDASADWVWVNASESVISETNTYKTSNAGTYYVYQKFGECLGAKTKVTLAVNPLPQVSITIESSFCSNESLVVDLSGQSGVFKVDGEEATSFNPSEMSIGKHVVTYSYTDENNCTASTQSTFSVDDCSLPAVTSVVLNESILSLQKNETASLSVTIKPAESPQTVNWESSNPSVATVDENGVVTAVGRGTATITATSTYTSSQSASCSVTVLSPLSSVTFTNSTAITMMEGKTTNVAQYLEINPDDAVIASVEWSSSSSALTVVDGVITAGSVSSETTVNVTVTVTSGEGTVKSATIPVTIVPFTIDLTALNMKIVEAMTAIADNESIKGDAVGNIPASSFKALQNAIAEANAVVANPPAEQSSVDAQTILLNSAIKNFLNSVIPNIVTEIAFEETLVYMIVGEEYTPDVTYAPNGAFSDLVWMSSNSDVVRVYGSGKIVAMKQGSVAITASLPNNMSITARLIVIVSDAPELESVTMNKLGNQIEMTFSEKMATPDPEIYSDLYVYGVNVSMYNVMDVYVDPNNAKKLIVVVGAYIDDPSDICVIYKGKSIKSAAGGIAENFEYNFGKTAVDDVVAEGITAYPSIATNTVTVAGLQEGMYVTIVSANGTIVESRVASGNAEEFAVAYIAQGTYYVLVHDGAVVKAQRSFVKK